MSQVPNQVSQKVRKSVSGRFMFGTFGEGFGFFLCDGAPCSWGVLDLGELGDVCVDLVVVECGEISG